MNLLLETFVFLLATIVVVPVCRKFGLSTVLGYLLAGLLVGPKRPGAYRQTPPKCFTLLSSA